MIRGIIKIPWGAMWQVLKVFVFGARKHKNDLWCDVDYDWAYFEDKVDRHRVATWQGDRYDIETGYHHHAHAVCDLLMAMAKDVGGEMPDTAHDVISKRVLDYNQYVESRLSRKTND